MHYVYCEAGTATYVVMNVIFKRVCMCLDVLWMRKNGVGFSGHQIHSTLFSNCRFGSNPVTADVMNDFCQMLYSLCVCSVCCFLLLASNYILFLWVNK
jgi:hypothetical protein